MYKVQLSGRYENVLKDMHWSYPYLVLSQEYQYMGNYNNNAIHISSVAMHVGMVDMHILHPWPCQMWLHKYDAHMESHSFYISQIGYTTFHHTFCFL